MVTALTIAGSDCSGGAGIQADIKTMSAHGVFAMSVITSVVAENTCRVIKIEDISVDTVKAQIDAIYEDIAVGAVKVGMLSDSKIMVAVADKLIEYGAKNIVVDPVMYAKNGMALMSPDAIDTLIKRIVPIATVLTPNIPEAECISGDRIVTVDDMRKACAKIKRMGAKNVLIKGGHSDGAPIDVLLTESGEIIEYSGKRINTKNTHGTGCTLSSAIASGLALGQSVKDSVKNAKEYVTEAIRHSLEIGKGHGPTNHFHALYEKAGIITDK